MRMLENSIASPPSNKDFKSRWTKSGDRRGNTRCSSRITATSNRSGKVDQLLVKLHLPRRLWPVSYCHINRIFCNKIHFFPSILDGSGNFGGFGQPQQQLQLQIQQGQQQQPQQASPRGMVGGRAGTPQSPHPLLSPVGHMGMAGPMRPQMAQQQIHPQMVRFFPLLDDRKQKE